MSRDDYIEVSERIRMFKDAYPEGSLQSDWGFTERDGEQWLTVRAYAYRTADDAGPASATRGSRYQEGRPTPRAANSWSARHRRGVERWPPSA
jgi:hypothetical protein